MIVCVTADRTFSRNTTTFQETGRDICKLCIPMGCILAYRASCLARGGASRECTRRSAPRLMQTARGRAFLHVQIGGTMRYALAMTLIALSLILQGRDDMPKLRWVDDDKARNAVSNVVMKILREDKSLSYGDPKSDNLLVHGDNLEALKALLPFYAGRVKCIYIDPPYNTGSAFEHYDDNLEHSQWLGLMYPRLKMLKEFLSEYGSIWISIDDDEQAYLKVICDEIFGRQNFVASNVWQKRYSREGREAIGDSHEYIITYAKDPKTFKLTRNLLPFSEKQTKIFKNPDNDPRGPWQSVSMLAQGYRPNQMYEIVAPNGTVHRPPEGNCWRHVKSEYERLLADGRMYYGADGNNVPRKKAFLSEAKGLVPWTWLPHEEVGHTDEAKKEINVLFGSDNAFATPKPERLIQRILTIATNPGDLVLDSFLGSGTTAAVAQKMGRRWIGIEMGEHAKTHCAVRLKKVVDGEQGGVSASVGWKGGGGFKFYELGEPLLDENGAISEGIDFDTLAAHIWWRETEKSWDVAARNGTFLGVHDGIAYAMLYNGVLHDRSYAGGNVLTPKTMRIVREDIGEAKHDLLIVYGECTKLSAAKLKEEKVEFRQTPYDIFTRR